MDTKVKIYKIKSDVINDDDFVVANSPKDAIDCYVNKYHCEPYYMEETDITSIERVCDDCLISKK